MRFPVVFYRYLTTPLAGTPTPNTVLGSDSAPTPAAVGATGASVPTAEPAANADNALSVKSTSDQGGFPQRIAVLYGYVGAGAAPALTATMYFLEETTGLWFVVGQPATALAAGGVTWFDVMSIPHGAPFGGGASPGQTPDQTLYAGRSSAGRYLLVVAKVGNVAGQYYFAMAPVLTTSP